MTQINLLDLSFPLTTDIRSTFAEGNGYYLLAALTKAYPGCYKRPEVKIGPLRGGDTRTSFVKLFDSTTELRVRGLRGDEIEHIEGLSFDYNGIKLTAGQHRRNDIAGYSSLSADIVVTTSKDAEYIGNLLLQRGIADFDLGERKTMRVRSNTMIGYPVKVYNLTPEQSITLQCRGLGKYTSMGCGFFVGEEKEKADGIR